MAIAKMYGNFLAKALNKEIDLDTDTIKVMLCTSGYAPNQHTHIYKSSVTNEVSSTGTNYTTRGKALTGLAITYSTGVVKFDADNIQWDSSTMTARYAVIYQDTGNDTTSVLIGYVDFEVDQASSNGTFLITWDAGGIFTITIA